LQTIYCRFDRKKTTAFKKIVKNQLPLGDLNGWDHSWGSFERIFSMTRIGENVRRMSKMCISGCVHLRSTTLGKIRKEKNDKMGIF